VTITQNLRAVCSLERAVLCLAVLYLFVHTLPRAWRTLNTDFPNYYMSARLAHEGYDTSRMYEWSWIEREKDHRAVDIRVIGLLPITPFSTLAMWPLTELAPLTAKHIWILLNLAFLIPIGWMLRSMTGLSYQRIALAFSLCFPLHRNLLFGQFYVFLLLLIVAACWSYLRGFSALAGALVALAAACKVFPVLLFVFFLQRRDWRALASGAVTGLAAATVSIAVFGWNVHRTYLHEILPWALRGGGLQPYIAGASISSVLHYLFLSEPQWNPHPWHYSPLCYALLLPALQILALAPAILLIRREDVTQGRILLEWSALLTASLADLRADAASYNFVLMVFPVCVLAAALFQRKQYGWLATLLIVYLGIGFPLAVPHRMMGPAILLFVPRLPLIFALLLGIYVLLWRDRPSLGASRDLTRYVWAAAMAVSLVFSVFSTFRLEQAVRQEYAYRLPLSAQGFLNGDPRSVGTGVRYIAFGLSGYHLVTEDQNVVWTDPPPDSSDDDLSFTGLGNVRPEKILVERTLNQRSRIVDVRQPSHAVVDDARDPQLLADGQSLAFVRDDHGRGQLRVRRAFQSDAAGESALTPSSLDVYEASFVSDKEYAFSAVEQGRVPQIYLSDATHANAPLALGESRYPALSPDGRWMAYSRLDHGGWNLWLRDQRTGATRRVTDVPCNQIEPAWEEDSKTLLYSTDCGRSLWFTAVARRRVIP
jgi:Glycosyltransferase family 87/WD40-like Beta Propeller Repeat